MNCQVCDKQIPAFSVPVCTSCGRKIVAGITKEEEIRRERLKESLGEAAA